MPEEKTGAADFKVYDRRSFHADGTPREEKGTTANQQEAVQEKTSPEPSPVSSPSEPDAGWEQESPANFDTLVYYLSTTTLFQLGLVLGPGGEKIPPDLANARRTIDLLDVLRDKTRGNLSQSETKLLDAVLYELRLNFVEVRRRQSK